MLHTSPPGLPELQQTYSQALPELSVPHAADPVPRPRLLELNRQLARDLGLDPGALAEPAGLALLTGRVDAQGRPVLDPRQPPPDPPFTTAQAYAGYQFGQPNPQLGDGRAVLLGDVLTPGGERRDLHLKGSGPTPFARAGDGKAPLGPMLREALIGEFLHAIGIPTTRALAVIGTGESVRRRGPGPEPGAILVRVAASHLRVGTLQYAAWHLGPDVLARLVDLALERHHPDLRDAENPAHALLEAVTDAQADLVARWMLVGFVHGVMNTDNMTLSGESIDFGPCAFLDEMRADAVFSSIDTQGRYAYGNQPGIALWNLSRLAEALLPVIDAGSPDRAVAQATAVLERFEGRYLRAWTAGMAAKLGVPLPPDGDAVGQDATGGDATDGDTVGEDATPSPAADVRGLGEDLLRLLESQRVDLTGFFRALGEGRARGLFSDPAAFDTWEARRQEILTRCEPAAVTAAGERMPSVNPLVIPRNRHVESALRAAGAGDMAPFRRLLAALRDPFVARPGEEDLAGPGEGSDPVVTFCGT